MKEGLTITVCDVCNKQFPEGDTDANLMDHLNECKKAWFRIVKISDIVPEDSPFPFYVFEGWEPDFPIAGKCLSFYVNPIGYEDTGIGVIMTGYFNTNGMITGYKTKFIYNHTKGSAKIIGKTVFDNRLLIRYFYVNHNSDELWTETNVGMPASHKRILTEWLRSKWGFAKIRGRVKYMDGD